MNHTISHEKVRLKRERGMDFLKISNQNAGNWGLLTAFTAMHSISTSQWGRH